MIRSISLVDLACDGKWEMSFANWLVKRPRIDYLIILLLFLFISSNHVFENTLLRPTGTVDVTYGSAIPQETNYTITNVVEPSVTAAVIFNHSFRDAIFFRVPFESLSWIRLDLTLRAESNDTVVNYRMRVEDLEEEMYLSIGTDAETFSFNPNITGIVPSTTTIWLEDIHVSIDTTGNVLAALVVHTQYSEPVCPVTIDFQSTDGFSLFKNEYTKQMYYYYRPNLEIEGENSSYSTETYPCIVNQTYYMKPGNYSCSAGWGYRGHYQEFNIRAVADEATYIIVRMQAVRLDISTNTDIPLVKLTIDHYSDWVYRELFFESAPPEFLYIPGFSYETRLYFELATPEFLSRHIDHYEDVRAEIQFEYNSTNHVHLDVEMPYLRVSNIVVTPHDFIRIVLAVLGFFATVLRLGFYFNDLKPRTLWRDKRLIPAVILLAIAVLPWFSSVRNVGFGYGVNKQVTMHALGPFPLVLASIGGETSLVVLPANGFAWAVASLFLFWIPLLLVMFRYSTPSTVDYDMEAILILFSPFLFILMLGYDLPNIFYSSIMVLSYLNYVLFSIPLIWALVIMILWTSGKYRYGILENQLKHDFEISLMQETDEVTRPKELEGKEVPFQEPTLIVRLVFRILAMLVLAIPTVLGFEYRYDYYVSAYRLEGIFFDNPLAGFVNTFAASFNPAGAGLTLLLFVVSYYWFTAAIVHEIRVKSRNLLNFILVIVWAIIPFVAFGGLALVSSTYRVTAWLCVSFPSMLLSLFAIWKAYQYVISEIRISTSLLWIVLSIVGILPGWLILSTLAELQFAKLTYTLVSWIPIPIISIMLLILIWPISTWGRREMKRLEQSTTQPS